MVPPGMTPIASFAEDWSGRLAYGPRGGEPVELLSRSRLLGGTAAAAAVACAPLPLRAQPLAHIRVAGVATDDMTPIYWAVKSGMYAKAGLDVEIVPVSSGTAATTAVVAGAYEIG